MSPLTCTPTCTLVRRRVLRETNKPLTYTRKYTYGAWRSSVARLLWEQEVPGSNPGAPTDVTDSQLIDYMHDVDGVSPPIDSCVHGACAAGSDSASGGLLLALTGPLSDVDFGLIPECAHVRSSNSPERRPRRPLRHRA